jgi:hypothetical protein
MKCDDTRAENKFRLSAKRASSFKSAGASSQSTTGSRGVRISGSNAGYTMFRGSMKGTGYPLQSPVSPSLLLPMSPCAITSLWKIASLWEMFIWIAKWWEVMNWGESVSAISVEKITRNYKQFFLNLPLYTVVSCLGCVAVSCLVCTVVVVLLSSYV